MTHDEVDFLMEACWDGLDHIPHDSRWTTTIDSASRVNAQLSQNRAYVWLVGFTAALGGFLFGYDTGVIGGAMPALEKYFQMQPAQLGFAVAIVFVGSIVGALCGGWLSDEFGRRRVLLLTGVMFLASALLAGFAQTVLQFNVGRFIGGIGIGISLPIVGIYLAEIAPAEARGRIVSLNQLIITFGILISYVAGWLGSGIGDESWQLNTSWRWAFGSQAVPSILFLGALLFIPESPRWLIQQGRIDEAIAIMTRINGRERAILELSEVRRVIEAESSSIGQLLRPGLRRALMIGIMLSLFDQITGINIVIYYIQKILIQLNFTEEQARQGMLALGVNNFVTTILALALVDRVGRKTLLIVCALGMGVSMFLVAVQFHTQALPPAWVLVAIMAYCFCYALGPGPVALLILSEIFPTHVRGQATGISTIFLWVSCYVVSAQFPSWLAWSEAGTFLTLACMCLLYALYSLIVIPETRGKTLEQIEQHWTT